jgi:hypothetical protein
LALHTKGFKAKFEMACSLHSLARKMTQRTPQTVRDNNKVTSWKERCGVAFQAMDAKLQGRTVFELIIEAMKLCHQAQLRGQPISKIGRLEKRLRDALICWFCENCPDMPANGSVGAKSNETMNVDVQLSETTNVDVQLSETINIGIENLGYDDFAENSDWDMPASSP